VRVALLLLVWACFALPAFAYGAPPPGAGEDEPALPAGLEEEEPALPHGLGANPSRAKEEPATPSAPWLDLHGFVETRFGARLQDDPGEDDASLAELRLHLSAHKAAESFTARLAGDLLLDALADESRPDLETGAGAFDLREAWLLLSPLSFMDLKAGRQILTWGTGDLLFIHDLFPKDWASFLLGRDDTYLKAPSDAARLSLFALGLQLDLVYVPLFDGDRLPLRERVSSFEPSLGRIAGAEAPIDTRPPDEAFAHHEIAARLAGRAGPWELAAYGYHGFWKSPAGFDPGASQALYPALSAYGASARGPLLGGIANLEAGLYDSREDRSGDDPLVRNSEIRVLAGLERELAPLLSLGVQYYVERRLDHDAHVASLPPGAVAGEETRHVATARLTWLALAQRLRVSFFAFWGINEGDAFLLPRLRYDFDDRLRAELGANLFFGAEDHTFFGSFRRNTSAMASLRHTW